MAVPTYSELLDTYLTALTALATSQSYTINGRTFTRQNLKEMRDMVDWLTMKIAADDPNSSTGFVLVRFNQPQ